MRTALLLLINVFLLGVALISGVFLFVVALGVISATLIYLLIRGKLAGRYARGSYEVREEGASSGTPPSVIEVEYHEIRENRNTPNS